MHITEKFRRVFGASSAENESSELVPSRLAAAAAAVLPVDGASISFVHRDLRVPLGADGPASATAERLQFTVGDGPCMQAGRHNIVIDAPSLLLRSRWPLLADEWARHTPYRSAASIPIPIAEPTHAALNLFFSGSDSAGLHPVDATAVAQLIAWELVGRSPSRRVDDLLRTPVAGARLRIWLAVGMVSDAHHLVAQDALALLRAHAYARGASVDQVAAQLVDDPGRVAELQL